MTALWYIVYLLCLWDVETILLVLPPGGETLALRIFNLLHYGHNAQVNALCLWLLGVAAAPAILWSIIRYLLGRRKLLLWLPLVGAWACGCAPSSNSKEQELDSRLFSHVRVVGTRGAGASEFSKPRSVAVDAEDNLYVVDMTGRVQKFSPEGRFLLAWQMPQTDLGKAKGMCRDQAGRIVVLEPHYQRINHFSPDGKLVAQWGHTGTNLGQFSQPRSVAVNTRGDVLVSEYTLRERVQVFSAQGRQFRFAFGQAGTGAGEFSRPEGIGVDAKDCVYVADSCNHRVQVFSPEGKFLRAYGRPGRGQGEFSYPYDVRVDSAGRQYVCEFGNSRIQVLDEQDRTLEILGGPGAALGRFANPWGLALDSKGNLYVADSLNHRVQKFIRRNATGP